MQTLRVLKKATQSHDMHYVVRILDHTAFFPNITLDTNGREARHYACYLWGSSIFYFSEVLNDNSLE